MFATVIDILGRGIIYLSPFYVIGYATLMTKRSMNKMRKPRRIESQPKYFNE